MIPLILSSPIVKQLITWYSYPATEAIEFNLIWHRLIQMGWVPFWKNGLWGESVWEQLATEINQQFPVHNFKVIEAAFPIQAEVTLYNAVLILKKTETIAHGLKMFIHVLVFFVHTCVVVFVSSRAFIAAVCVNLIIVRVIP